MDNKRHIAKERYLAMGGRVNISALARELKVGRRTIYTWRDKDQWDRLLTRAELGAGNDSLGQFKEGDVFEKTARLAAVEIYSRLSNPAVVAKLSEQKLDEALRALERAQRIATAAQPTIPPDVRPTGELFLERIYREVVGKAMPKELDPYRQGNREQVEVN